MRKAIGSNWYAVQPDDAVTYFQMNKECCFCTLPENMYAKLRRRGEECYALEYEVYDKDCNGALGIRWQSQDFNCLKPGRYELTFFVRAENSKCGCSCCCDEPCASYEIQVGMKADVVPGVAYSVKYKDNLDGPDTETLEIC